MTTNKNAIRTARSILAHASYEVHALRALQSLDADRPERALRLLDAIVDPDNRHVRATSILRDALAPAAV